MSGKWRLCKQGYRLSNHDWKLQLQRFPRKGMTAEKWFIGLFQPIVLSGPRTFFSKYICWPAVLLIVQSVISQKNTIRALDPGEELQSSEWLDELPQDCHLSWWWNSCCGYHHVSNIITLTTFCLFLFPVVVTSSKKVVCPTFDVFFFFNLIFFKGTVQAARHYACFLSIWKRKTSKGMHHNAFCTFLVKIWRLI